MPKRVLIAEDEPHIAEALRFILEREGFAVDVVGDGALVLEHAKKLSPEVLILDVMLPKRTGFELLKDIHGAWQGKKPSIIMLTAKGQSQDRQIALCLGVDEFMTKPFANKDVVAAVKRLTAG
jgi:DNA-binding response OmpR family regulator